MFSFITNSLKKLYTTLTTPLQKIFAQDRIDAQTLADLERILIEADTGVATTKSIIASIKKAAEEGKINEGKDIKQLLRHALLDIITQSTFTDYHAPIILLVGINGSGKTTCVSKLAHRFTQTGKRVLLVAADTFRAAATEQLVSWARAINVDIVKGEGQQDPASVIFQGCQKFLQGSYDHMIIDTAGRLQTKVNLMKELEKIRRVIGKQLPNIKICTLLTIDSMLGQNSFEQAKLFHESTPLDGIILTKMDGTGKGGIICAITQSIHVPIAYISYGEQVEALAPFDAKKYVATILGE